MLDNSSLLPCLFVFALGLMIPGCATTQYVETNEQEVITRHATQILDGSTNFFVVVIPSRGPQADAAFIAQSKSDGPSILAHELARVFEQGEMQDIELVVVGSNSEKTAQVLDDAFYLNRGIQLSKLKLVFMGDPEHRAIVEKSAAESGAALYFGPYPPRS